MKSVHFFVLLSIGCAVYGFGVLQKILHSPTADKFMQIGKLVVAVSVVAIIFLKILENRGKGK